MEVVERIKYGPMKSGALSHSQRITATEKIIQQAMKEVGVLSKRDLFMLGIGIYIGEGSKSIESVRIVNSDPEVIRTAIAWFKECCGLDNTNIMISLYLYPDSDIAAATDYWHTITGLPLDNFKSTHIDRRLGKKLLNSGKLQYGTVQLRINAHGNPHHGVVLFRRIQGWMQAALDIKGMRVSYND